MSVRFIGSAFIVAVLLAVATEVSAQSSQPTSGPDPATAASGPEPTAVTSEPAPSAATSSSTATPDSTPSPKPSAPAPETSTPSAPTPARESPSARESRTGEKVLYFTFDDGPNPTWTPQVIALLEQHDARATFFQVGEAAAEHPALVELVRTKGHNIGNHTWSHPRLTSLSVADVTSQLTRTNAVIGPTMCARPPMGDTNASVRETFAALGQSEQLWDIDTQDWSLPGPARIVRTVLDQAAPGAVVLMHDGRGDRSETIAALATLLPELTQDGWRIEALPEC